MGIDFDDVKNVASEENIDRAADFAKSRFGEHADKIDAGADRAKDFLGGDQQSERRDENAGGDYGRHSGGDYGESPSGDERGGEQSFSGGRYDQEAGGYGEASEGNRDSERGYGG